MYVFCRRRKGFCSATCHWSATFHHVPVCYHPVVGWLSRVDFFILHTCVDRRGTVRLNCRCVVIYWACMAILTDNCGLENYWCPRPFSSGSNRPRQTLGMSPLLPIRCYLLLSDILIFSSFYINQINIPFRWYNHRLRYGKGKKRKRMDLYNTYLIDNAGKMSDRKLDMHSMHCSIFFSEKLMDRLQKVV